MRIVYRCFVVQVVSCAQLFVTQGSAAHQDSLSFTISWRLLKFMSIELVVLSDHLILCCPLLLLPSVFPSIRVFSNELPLHITVLELSLSIRALASTSVLPINIQGLGMTGLISLLSKGLLTVLHTVWKHRLSGAQPSLWSYSHIHIQLLEKP